MLPLQLGREPGLCDQLCALAGECADAARMVEVRVRQDHVADVVRVQAAAGQGGSHAVFGRPGVDRDDTAAGADKGEVGEVVALRHPDAGRHLDDPRIAEMVAVGRVRPAAAELKPRLSRSRRQARICGGLGCPVILAGGGKCRGQAVVDRADHVARELVADGEYELQVGDGLPGMACLSR